MLGALRRDAHSRVGASSTTSTPVAPGTSRRIRARRAWWMSWIMGDSLRMRQLLEVGRPDRADDHQVVGGGDLDTAGHGQELARPEQVAREDRHLVLEGPGRG